MIERAKAIALTALVMLSLLLTGRLMVGFHAPTPGPDQPFYLRVAEKPEVDVRQVLRPTRIVVHLGGNQHAGLYPGSPAYAALWDSGLLSRAVLGEVAGAPRETGVDLKALRAEQGSIEIVLPVRLPFSQWMVIWTGYAWTGGPDFDCDRIAVSTGKNPAVFAYSHRHGKYLRFDMSGLGRDSAILISEIAEIVKTPPSKMAETPAEINGVTIDRGVFLPAEPPAASLLVRSESVAPDQVLQQFFLDRSVVRRIEENDGAVIFSDGRQGLRIYSSGAIEYSCPLVAGDASAMDDLTAVEKSLEFVAAHGGLPEGVFLVGSMGRAHRFSAGLSEVRFSYAHGGAPVFGDEPPLSVTLSSQGAEGYVRNIKTVIGPAAVTATVRGEEALTIVTRHWSVVFPEWVERSIRDMYCAYWSPSPDERQDTLKLVWVVESAAGLRAFVDARSGAVWGEDRL